MRTLNTCRKCNYRWFSHEGKISPVCPHCKTTSWNTDKLTKRIPNTCRKCGHRWLSRKVKLSRCPHCQTRLWNRERKKRDGRGQYGDNAKTVISLRQKHPCMSAATIASKVGISRERARQILKRDSLPTKRVHQTYVCQNCGATIETRRRFCSRQCQYEYTHPLVECDQCHTLFRKWQGFIKRERFNFCSRKCLGNYTGSHYGFMAHPENRHPERHKRKYDYDLIITETHNLRQQGYTYKLIAKQLNIPWATLCSILTKTHSYITTTILHRVVKRQQIRVNWLLHLNFTESEIVKITHCSSSTVSRARNRS